MPLDWDKLRVFHATAEAGSFTRASDTLHISQSAISRQVSALEHEIGTALFQRHARGLALTEEGEALFRTAREFVKKLEIVKDQLNDSRDKPEGSLRVTTTVGLGSFWLTERIPEFTRRFPDIALQLLFFNQELDLATRKADCAIWLRAPAQGDLIQRKLFTVHLHVYASPQYLAEHGTPQTVDDLDEHRIVTFGERAPDYLMGVNWLETAGRTASNPRRSSLKINSLNAIKRAVGNGCGIGVFPDYMVDDASKLTRILVHEELPTFEAFFCYPEEMRGSARLVAFRDFLVANAASWRF
ncbi:MAG: LysR family transcriptional regulator [Pseudomonadota bacterium]